MGKYVRWIEYCDKVNQRNNFTKLDDFHKFEKKPFYTSYFSYLLPEGVEANPDTIKDCPLIANFAIEFDEPDVKKGKFYALKIVNWLISKGLPADEIQIAFSGHRSFHIYTDRETWGITTSKELDLTYKAIARKLSKELNIPLDLSIYERRKLLRYEDAIHEKTGLKKTFLTYEQLSNLGVEKIKELAKKGHPTYHTQCHAQPIDFFVDFALKAESEYVGEVDFDILLQGVNEGERNVSAIKVASLFRYQFNDKEKCWDGLVSWNALNRPPLPETELKRVFQSAWRNKKPYYLKAIRGYLQTLKVLPQKRSLLAFEEKGIIHEAILFDGKLTYLTFDGNKFDHKPIDVKGVKIDTSSLLEFSKNEIEGCEVLKGVKGVEYIIWSIRAIGYLLDKYVTLSLGDKFLIIAAVLLTYFQRIIDNVCLIDVFGETGSGKSFFAKLLSMLMYRAKWIESATEPNLFHYDGGFAKTLILDEMRDFEKDKMILKALRASSKKGVEVLRLIDPRQTGEYEQISYSPFGLKVIVKEDPVYDPALARRCIKIHMVKDPNKKDEIDQADLIIFQQVRKLLLLTSMALDLPKVEEEWLIGGEQYDLYNPLLRVSKFYSPLYEGVCEAVKKRIEWAEKKLQTTPEYWIASVVCSFLKESSDVTILRVPFNNFWESFKKECNLKEDGNDPNQFYSEKFEGRVSKSKVGKIISRLFNPNREHGREGNILIFDAEMLSLALVRFGLKVKEFTQIKVEKKIGKFDPIISPKHFTPFNTSQVAPSHESQSSKEPDKMHTSQYSPIYDQAEGETELCSVCGNSLDNFRFEQKDGSILCYNCFNEWKRSKNAGKE